jgi:hypothetical protein
MCDRLQKFEKWQIILFKQCIDGLSNLRGSFPSPSRLCRRLYHLTIIQRVLASLGTRVCQVISFETTNSQGCMYNEDAAV